jgi:hypothetical protein
MSHADEAFAGLKATLEITQTETDLAATRHKLIRDFISERWDITDDFLTGSYRRHTKTKRLQDVDIFIVLDPEGEQGGYAAKSPTTVLEALRSLLNERWDDVLVDRMAAVVSYGDEVASFEVVPAFDRQNGGYLIPDAKSGTWIATDPTVHQELTTKKNSACNGKYVPFVKMIKGINRELGDPVSPSFLLEVMALELAAEPFGRFQDEVSWFLATAAERLDEPWPDPAGLGPDVNAEMDALASQTAKAALAEAAEVAQRAVWLEDDDQGRAAVEEWRRLFGWRMPRP